ncbi:MAG TPA: NifB/NifX family molybdenum-iron cluster-binding protein [Geobacteraceae bacterium]|nr:NifB/NifX family molybdenum-iron cluster-binding protein [Geobacteraceae bacterium]
MKLCFPIITAEGLDSAIYGHFASAPRFLVVNTASMHSHVIANCDPEKLYAGCNPFMALRDQKLDGIVVEGIGDDALRTMNMCGFRVFQAESTSVRENMELFARQALPELEVLHSDLEGPCDGNEGERSCGGCHSH